ncbi:MAG TPA: PLP-dependent aminotransferase family protein [Candidatus Polarisedimenticolaceae bacterium]|nr:PLP-dependent aminotransferase family protein [Candidatus Polarisedimenticolaceae bacterium]
MGYWDTFKVEGTGPKYVALCDALAEAIRAGRLKPGRRLPSHRLLARKLGLSVGTITHAYEELRRRGLVIGEVGRGSFVTYFAPWPLSVVDGSRIPDGCIDLYQNLPVQVPEVEDDAWALAFGELQSKPDLTLRARASWTEISARSEQAGAAWMGRVGFHPDPRRVRDCPGVMVALNAIIGAAAQPGEGLLAPSLSHRMVRLLGDQHGLKVRPVDIDRDGILPDSLDETCRKYAPRLLYCTPTLHSPTTATMPGERRQEIASLAERHDLVILEDESAAFLLEDPTPPIAALAPDRTFFVADTWMALSLGLRTTYVFVPEPLEGTFARTLAACGGTAIPFMAEIAASWIQGDVANRLIEARGMELALRNAMTREALQTPGLRSHPRGHHVWLELPPPWRSDRFAAAARDAGVVVHDAAWFALDPDKVPAAVRISIGNAPDRSVLREALERLARVLEHGPSLLR